MAILTETHFVNDFLNFFNFTPEEEDKVLKTNFKRDASIATEEERSHGSIKELFLEEDLEWISDKDAFPSVDTCFDISSENLDLVLNNHSPVSVLEKSTTNVSSFLRGPRRLPGRPRSKGWRKKRTSGFDQLLGLQVWVPTPTRSNDGGAFMGRMCSHCQTDNTPQWRAGPMGPKTLCNACGVRYKMGRLVPEYRPINSPTFSSALHSNSHRKILEMRRNK